MNSWRSKIELQVYTSINQDWSHICSVKYDQTSKYRCGEGKRGEWREPERERESNIPEFSYPLLSAGPADQYSADLNQQKGECL